MMPPKSSDDAQNATEAQIATMVASAELPTHQGDFRIQVFRTESSPEYDLSREHVALVKGNVAGKRDVLVRLQSECLTGEVFGSLRCDCREQLSTAQRAIEQEGAGIVLYLRQEGRGIGLTNKIRAYALQDEGADTVDANLALHLPADARDYGLAASILLQLGVHSVRLLSNSPHKEQGLRDHGVEVAERIPVLVKPTRHSEKYLRVKVARMDHQIPTSDE
jgi:3,4-dihydroxy 2-butanone 4-phosphate synthase/GTP cyclohydrolase II